MNKENKGFIALAIVLSVAGTLMALVFSSSVTIGLFFDQAMKKEYRTMNYYYAYDCLDQAILAVTHDYFLTISVPIEIEEYHCSIISITKEGDIRHISARGDFQKAYVYRSADIKLNTHNLEVIKIN